MSSYNQNHIKLQDAMSMELKQSIRVWEVSGHHIDEEDIPENATTSKTFVTKFFSGNIILGIEWTIVGDKSTHFSRIAQVSTLEEIHDKFPHLFDLEGILYAFS